MAADNERQTDVYLSTLRSYVEAMGGTLQLKAGFPDATVFPAATVAIATLGDLDDSSEQHTDAQEAVGL